MLRGFDGLVALALAAGCGASTVSSVTLDAATTDLVEVDAGSIDVGSIDAFVRDAGVPDTGRDVPPEARVCPRPFDGDVGRVPTEVPGLRDVEQVVTIDTGVTCTRHRDGTVRCWGSNRYDMLGVGHEGDETCDRGRPCRRSPTLVPGLTDVVYLAAAYFAVCAVSRDGSVRCWGNGDVLLPRGAAPTPVLVTELTDVARLRTFGLGWVVQRRSGEYDAYRVGLSGDGPVSIPREAEFVDGDTAFAEHLCYRLPDDTARCFGVNWVGKLGDGRSAPSGERFNAPSDPGLCGVRSVATGAYNSCALLVDRTVECWGDGTRGALGFDPPDLCGGLSGREESPCATHPAPVRGLDRVDRIFVGVWGGCALRLDHSVWCWGRLGPDFFTGELGPVTW